MVADIEQTEMKRRNKLRCTCGKSTCKGVTRRCSTCRPENTTLKRVQLYNQAHTLISVMTNIIAVHACYASEAADQYKYHCGELQDACNSSLKRDSKL